VTHDTLELTDQEVLLHAHSRLQEHLPLHADGYVCTTDDLLAVLLAVATHRGTIESVCADLVGSPDPQTIRGYFNEQLRVEGLPELERRLNAALAAELPRRVRRQAREVAVDFHDRPYYGKTAQAQGLWVRGKTKDGTTRFYRVATAYVLLNGLRVTLALCFVLPELDTVRALHTLLTYLKKQGIRVACLYLDKGFAGIGVMDYLTRRQQPAVIACPIRGHQGGTRALCRGTTSYLTPHTFRGGQGTEFTALLAGCRAFTTAKRTKRLKRRATWLLFILIHLFLLPQQVRCRYRRRFGVETSYRCSGQVRGWTTALNPAYRFLLIALAFVLLNVWLHLRWIFTQVPRRGQRWLDTKRFQLTRFAQFLRRALERLYGCVQAITAPAAPRC
jgi:hypothetical protein